MTVDTVVGVVAGGYVLLAACFAALDGKFSARGWLLQLFIACDQLVNVLVTPFNRGAWADETLSSRAFRAEVDGTLWGQIWRPVIDLLFIWQGPKHCQMAFEKERQRVHSPPEQR